MKRDLYQNLINWKDDPYRKPLILKGARQVGKTYLLQQFAKQEYQKHVYLNFDLEPKLNDFFKDDLKPERLLRELSARAGTKIDTDTLLIFDEIQECPLALNSLKYFQEMAPDIPLIAAGSLLGVKLTSPHSFPVGKVDFLELKPLSFLEFLTALNQDMLREFLNEHIPTNAISTPLHEQLIDYLKQYFIVGGMPEAVLNYVRDNDFNSVRKVQKNILEGYVSDFVKHAEPTDVMKIISVWNAIPSQLAKENKKFKFSTISGNARSREYEASLQWLESAGMVYLSCRTATIKTPLDGYIEHNAFKIYMLDIGLLGCQSQLPIESVLQGDQLFIEFKGALTENYVAQELIAQGIDKLYYWFNENRAEVDFIVQHNLQYLPLEVKSGTNIKSKSLTLYTDKYKPSLVLRTSLLNFKRDGALLNIPLYALANLKNYLVS
ncbi:MAG: ATPase [Coxiella sp. (in: Bacteria)]|nr:MAG: ATPase [Coxiella sp. (in: g-proteobacteria)]